MARAPSETAALARRAWLALAAAAGVAIAGCGGKRPPDIGTGTLVPCPGTPNCVSSVDPPATPAFVEPFWVSGPPEEAWAAAHETIEGWARVELVALTGRSLHAEVKSFTFRFVDDLELVLHPHGLRIDVRSASRVGRSDLGVNRRRVERLRKALVERGVVTMAPPISLPTTPVE